MPILIRGAKAIDPASSFNGQTVDIHIVGERIAEISRHGEKFPKSEIAEINGGEETAVRIVEASGLVVFPGLIDMHVHLREPGHEYKETVETGTRAAVSGGFTAVCSMPNTNPVNDNAQTTGFILAKAKEAGFARVLPAGAISVGSRGDALCEYGELKDAGAVAVTDDGNPVRNARLMRSALEYAKGFGLLVISHCEDLDLVGNGVMNEGAVATRIGLAGIPNACESVMVMREIALSELADAHVHIAHVSAKESVRAIRDAKKRGVKVTAETAPHYFTLTDKAVEGYDTDAKMNPPLRSDSDREEVRIGLADGTIDAIATDHAPHGTLEKDVEFDRAANGIVGLETSLALSLDLVRNRYLSLSQLAEKMSTNPARLLGLDYGLASGKLADMTLVDPERQFVVDVEKFHSKSRNTPFKGWKLKGAAVATIVGGKVVFES